MENKIIIGITGVARSGKDTFTAIAKELLKEKGFSVSHHALANELKRDCEQFLQDNCGVDVWTQDTDIKDKFRPFLLWYGDYQRKLTNGRYWIDKVSKVIENDNNQIHIVSDVRYKFYDFDESDWIKSYPKGYLVHIERVSNGETVVFPPNDHEKRNDPKMKEAANIRVEWQNVTDCRTQHPTLIDSVNTVLQQIKPLWTQTV